MGSYGNNITISYPGEDWQLLWPDGLGNFQLDIVGFLAILGEASILANAQVSALSRLFLVPRLLPAPQALLRVSRPDTLPSTHAYVTAVNSANNTSHVHHVASVLLGTRSDELRRYWVRCVKITKNPPQAPSVFDWILRGQPKSKTDEDKANSEKHISYPATVKAKAAGPLAWVTLLAVLLTGTLFVASLVYGDGMSLMATISLSMLSTICGIANKWELSLPVRPKDGVKSEEEIVVIRYPDGSYLVVKCDENIARELFFAPEEIQYTIKSSSAYRILALVGSVILMIGVILLANARLELQIGWAGAYVILNAAHWAAAALPAKMHWDLSCYTVQEESIGDGPANRTFTDALWKVILVTKNTRWVGQNDAAPKTKAWDAWLKKARKAAINAPEAKYGDLIRPLRAWNNMDGHGLVHRDSLKFDPRLEFRMLYQDPANAADDLSDADLEDGLPEPTTKAETVIGAQQVSNGNTR